MNIFVFILFLLSPSENERLLKGEPIILKVERTEHEGGAKAMILINEHENRVFDVLCDVKDFPKFMPSLEKVEVLQRNRNSHIVRMFVKKAFVKFDYTLRRVCDREKMEVRWVGADEKFEKIDGYWRLEPVDEGRTKVIYYTYLKPSFFIPQVIIDYLQKRSLPDMLNALKRWIEEGIGKVKEKRKGKGYDF